MGRRRDETRTVKNILDFEVEGIGDVVGALERLINLFDEGVISLDRVSSVARGFGLEVPAAAHESEQAFDRFADAVRGAADQVRGATAVTESYEVALRSARAQADIFGDVASRLSAFGGLASGLGLGGVAQFGMLAADIFDATEAAKLARPAIQQFGGALSLSMEELALVALPAGLALTGIGVAISQLIQGLQEDADRLRAELEARRKVTEEVAEGLTSEEARQAIEDRNELIMRESRLINENNARLAEYREQLNRNLGVFGGLAQEVERIAGGPAQAIIEQIDKSREAIRQAQAEIQQYRLSLEEEGVAANDATEATQKLNRQLLELGQRVIERGAGNIADFFAGLGEGLQGAIERTRERNEELARVAQEWSEQETAIWQDFYRQRADIEDRYAETLVKIAEDAAQAAEDALQGLQDELADIGVDEQREALQARIDVQREEAQAAREHARNMRDIRERAQQQESDLIARRDFAGLFTSRRNTRQQLEEEQQRYEDQRQERAIQAEQEAEDRAREFEQRRADARRAYDRELRDLQQAQDRRRREAVRAYNTELGDLSTMLSYRLSALHQGMVEELRFASLTAAEKLDIEAQQQAAWLRIAEETLAQINALSPSATSPTEETGGDVFNTVNFTQTVGGLVNNQVFRRGVGNLVLGALREVLT